MINLLNLIFLFINIHCTVLDENLEIEIEFSDVNNYVLKKDEISYKAFEVFSIDKERWNNAKNFDLDEFDSKTFEIIKGFFKDTINVTILTNDDFVDIIILINYLGLKETLDEEEAKVFWKNIVNSVLKLIYDKNFKIENENIYGLYLCSNFIEKLFEKCLQKYDKKATIEFKQSRYSIHLYEKKFSKENFTGVSIEYFQEDYQLLRLFYTDKIIYWFAKCLNLSQLVNLSYPCYLNYMIFDVLNFNNLEIVKFNFPDFFNSVNTDYTLKELILKNVIKNSEDLSLLTVLSNLTKLTIKNNFYTKIIISNLKLENLTHLYFRKCEIQVRELINFIMFNDIEMVEMFKCHLVDSENCILRENKSKRFFELVIKSCFVDRSFHKWYTKSNNITGHRINDYAALNFFDDPDFNEMLSKRLKYQFRNQFSEEKIRNFINKKALFNCLIYRYIDSEYDVVHDRFIRSLYGDKHDINQGKINFIHEIMTAENNSQ